MSTWLMAVLACSPTPPSLELAAPSVGLHPDAPDTTVALSATASGGSAYTWSWSRDGEATAHTGPTVPAADTTRGQVWEVTVTSVREGHSSPPATATVTIANSAPSAQQVQIEPAQLAGGETPSCAHTLVDADQDTPTASIEWFVHGQSVGTDAPVARHGQAIACQVVPDDGTDVGPAARSATVFVGNHAPDIHSLAIEPASAHSEQALSAVIDVSDADGDTLSLTWSWQVDGTALPGTASTLEPGPYQRGDEVTVTVGAFDGYQASTRSSTITIGNAPPAPPQGRLEPSIAVAQIDDLVCAIAVPAADPDGDVLDHTIEWLVDGVAFTDAVDGVHSADTVPADALGIGQVWTCTIRATDPDGLQSQATLSTTIGDRCTPHYPADFAFPVDDFGADAPAPLALPDPDGLAIDPFTGACMRRLNDGYNLGMPGRRATFVSPGGLWFAPQSGYNTTDFYRLGDLSHSHWKQHVVYWTDDGDGVDGTYHFLSGGRVHRGEALTGTEVEVFDALAAIQSAFPAQGIEGFRLHDLSNPHLWVFVAQTDQTYIHPAMMTVDPDTLAVVGTLDLPSGLLSSHRQADVAVSPSGEHVLIEDYYSDELVALDRTLTVEQPIATTPRQFQPVTLADGRDAVVYRDEAGGWLTFKTLDGTGEGGALVKLETQHRFRFGLQNPPGWVLVDVIEEVLPPRAWSDGRLLLVELQPSGRVITLAHNRFDGDPEYQAHGPPFANPDFTRVYFESNWGASVNAPNLFELYVPEGALP